MSLTKRLLRRDDLSNPAIRQFSCGSLPRDVEINEFLRFEAVESVESGAVEVWIYFDETGEVVGFSSLGKTEWRYPKPNSDRVPLQIIPNLAIATSHQGNGYSSVMLDDTIAAAIELRDRVSELLGLFVHVENGKAIRLYLSRHFEPFSKPITRDGEGFQRMLLKLPTPSAN